MAECLFCDIAGGRVRSDIVYRDDRVVAFRDIKPQAPQHVLVVPVSHFVSLNDLKAKDEGLVGHMVLVAVELARREGFADSGYRLAVNCGREGGQAVPHLHLHLLGGRQMSGQLG